MHPSNFYKFKKDVKKLLFTLSLLEYDSRHQVDDMEDMQVWD